MGLSKLAMNIVCCLLGPTTQALVLGRVYHHFHGFGTEQSAVPVADLTESNLSVGTCISRALIGHTPLIERLNTFFLEARKLLETPALVVNALDHLSRCAGLNDDARQRIACHVVGADHLGTLIPPGVDADTILALAKYAGFNQRVVQCPSTIVARELGAKCGREKVPTQLLKASGVLSNGQRGGIEVFLPEVEPALAERWIIEGGEYHLALRVATRESIHAVHNELRAVGYPLPDFMEDHPMENPVEQVLLIYVDLPDGRMEFIHYEETESRGPLMP